MADKKNPTESLFQELKQACEPFASPRATMREGQPGYLDADVFHVEVTWGDWAKLVTAMGRMGASMLPMYAEIAKAEFSPEFIADIERIEKAANGS